VSWKLAYFSTSESVEVYRSMRRFFQGFVERCIEA
jgi:hypothetical protein